MPLGSGTNMQATSNACSLAAEGTHGSLETFNQSLREYIADFCGITRAQDKDLALLPLEQLLPVW